MGSSMHNKILQIIVLSLALVSFTVGQQTVFTPEGRISRQFSEITKGNGSWERGVQIREELERLRVKYSYLPFSVTLGGDEQLNGWNIVAELPGTNAAKTLMIGAHYDRVNEGIGAVDNASGSIVVLELLRAFKKNPLKSYNLKVAFWDLEERGLLGAKDYVKNSLESELPDIYINFDVFAYGDTIWLWTKDKKAKFADIFEKTEKSASLSSVITSTYPPSDYLAFALKTESYSFSLLTMDEIKSLTKILNGEKVKPEEFPEVFKTIHTDNDNLKKIDVKAISRALPIVEKAIRNLDKP